MRKLIFLFVWLLAVSKVNSQELNCLVTVNYNQVKGSNVQVFKTLEKSLTEFINQTQWTSREVKSEERIDCAFTIIITSREDNKFEATLQVQSTRPVYGTTYSTPILNIKDNDFSFRYNEFDPFVFNRNSYDSDLIATIVFYVHIILGTDADTFGSKGGENFLKAAQNIVLQAQQSGLSAWQNVVGKQNRFLLIDNLLSPKLKTYRDVLYRYHRQGLDNFFINPQIAKQTIENAVISLESIHNKSVGNYLIRLFFDAKADEIVNVYSDNSGTKNKSKLVQVVKNISPNNNSKWKELN